MTSDRHAPDDEPLTPAFPSPDTDPRAGPAEYPPIDRARSRHRPRATPGLAAFERPVRRGSDAAARPDPPPPATGPVVRSPARHAGKEDHRKEDDAEEDYDAEFDRELGLALDEPPARSRVDP